MNNIRTLNADRAKTMIESYAIRVVQELDIAPDVAFSIMESISLNFAKAKSNYMTNEFISFLDEIKKKESEDIEIKETN